jgi:hypothetical protein
MPMMGAGGMPKLRTFDVEVAAAAPVDLKGDRCGLEKSDGSKIACDYPIESQAIRTDRLARDYAFDAGFMRGGLTLVKRGYSVSPLVSCAASKPTSVTAHAIDK